MSKLFFGGVPTKMDVDKLMQHIDPEPGTSIPYDKIEELTGIGQTTNRFRTVTSRWRAQVFREKFVQVAAYGGAFHFLTADAALDAVRDRFMSVGRSMGRTKRRVSAIDPTDLSTEERRTTHRLVARETDALLEAVQKSAKAFAMPEPLKPANLRIAKS